MASLGHCDKLLFLDVSGKQTKIVRADTAYVQSSIASESGLQITAMKWLGPLLQQICDASYGERVGIQAVELSQHLPKDASPAHCLVVLAGCLLGYPVVYVPDQNGLSPSLNGIALTVSMSYST